MRRSRITRHWCSCDAYSITTEKLESVAYKPVNLGGIIHVFYSTIFAPFKAEVEKLKREGRALSEPFRNNYEIWIGYHAILQDRSRNNGIEGIEGVDLEALDSLLEKDRVRVAQMQVKQAEQTAKLLHRAMRASLSGDE